MRSPLELLSSLRPDRAFAAASSTAAINLAVSRATAELENRLREAIETRLTALQASFKERLDDLYGETWRLRDTIDARLGIIDKKVETTASRLELALAELETAASELHCTSQALTTAIQEQLKSGAGSLESVKAAHERRMHQLEESQRTQIGALERKHREALRAQNDSHSYVLGRVRALAEQMAAELEERAPSPFDSVHQSFLKAVFHKLKRKLRDGRLEELEDAVRGFARRLAELGQTEDLLAPKVEPTIPITTSYGQPAVPGSARGNGNGKHELDLTLTRS